MQHAYQYIFTFKISIQTLIWRWRSCILDFGTKRRWVVSALVAFSWEKWIFFLDVMIPCKEWKPNHPVHVTGTCKEVTILILDGNNLPTDIQKVTKLLKTYCINFKLFKWVRFQLTEPTVANDSISYRNIHQQQKKLGNQAMPMQPINKMRHRCMSHAHYKSTKHSLN